MAMNSGSEDNANTYVDFFAGCGGLSLGLGQAAWAGVFAIEKDPMAFASFHKNLVAENAPYPHFRRWPAWLTQQPHSIEDILGNEMIRKHLKALSGRVTLVAGGPPCQGFSIAGARNGDDPRNRLVFELIDAIRILRPQFAIVENVAGFERRFVSRPAGGMPLTDNVADLATGEIESLGYNVGKVLLNAADYGVPQTRKRVILFALSRDYADDLSPSGLLKDVLMRVGIEQRRELHLATSRYVNVEEALSDLAGDEALADPEFPAYLTCAYLPPTSAYQMLMRANCQRQKIPSCHRFPKHSAKMSAFYSKVHDEGLLGRLSKEYLYENGCHSNKRFVLDTTRPCSTLTTSPEEIIHYKHPRMVTLREMARLQSFPDDFAFCGRYTLNGPARGVDVPRNAQIGNAIPPLVGRALGIALREIMRMVREDDPRLRRYQAIPQEQRRWSFP